MARLTRILRYPVKGLSPQDMESAELAPGRALPFDRDWAIGFEGGAFDADAPRHLSKFHFAQLMKFPGLAAIESRFAESEQRLSLFSHGEAIASGRLDDPDEREILERALAEALGPDLEARPVFAHAPGLKLADIPEERLSLISENTVAEISQAAGKEIDAIRFRGNLHIEGEAPWREFDWVGGEVKIGEAVLRVDSKITRCPATSVDLDRAERDLDMPALLRERFGAPDCGVYLEVLQGGRIAPGDAVTPL